MSPVWSRVRLCGFRYCISYFSRYCEKVSGKHNLGRDGLGWTPRVREQLGQRKCAWQEREAAGTLHPRSGSREK